MRYAVAGLALLLSLAGCGGGQVRGSDDGELTAEDCSSGNYTMDQWDQCSTIMGPEWGEGGGGEGAQGDEVPSPFDALPVNERGNVPAEMGEPVTVLGEDGTELVRATVNSITVDHQCTGDEVVREEPENGHFIGVDMTFESLPGIAGYESPFGDPGFSVSGIAGSGFAVIGSDGFTEEGVSGGYAAFVCSDDENELLGQTVKAGQNYNGVIVLDSANTNGTLIWEPVVSSSVTHPGFEWDFS
jgi:hypothetical protein